MNILITGGAGYIGSHVAKALLQEKSHHITIIDNLSTGFPRIIETLQTIFPFEFVNLDLSDWQSVASFFKEHSFDAVIHFSASLIVPESLEKPLDYYLNNTANAINATHLIKVAIQTALGKREKMFIFGDDYATPDGTCIRDYIDVDDLALAHIQALSYLKDRKSDIFNCGYGKGFSVKEVLETMKRVSGVDFKAEVAPRREGDPAVLIANSDKIKTQMGWKPRYNDLALICQKALEWEKKL